MFSELSVTSADVFFCPTNSPKLKDSSSTDRRRHEQQMLTFKKLEANKLISVMFLILSRHVSVVVLQTVITERLASDAEVYHSLLQTERQKELMEAEYQSC